MKALAHMTTKENRTEADAILTKLIDGEKAFANRGDKDGGKGDRKKGDRRDQDDKDPRKRKPGPDDGEDNRGGAGSGPVPIEQEFGPNGPEGEDAEAAPGGVDEELENQVENWQATVDGIPAPD
jgi:hypothetical protein